MRKHLDTQTNFIKDAINLKNKKLILIYFYKFRNTRP